ncbi:MAG TPA: hypothetical protein PK239_11820 [Chitinophagales bacterium]|nr:hypothetical protein [Chitinophagales bacterium]
MWQSVQQFFFRYYFQNKLKEYHFMHEVVNLAQAKEIGILFDATNEQNAVWIRRFADELEKQKKRVSLLGFINSSNATEQTAYPTFSKKQTNWYLQPNHYIPADFMERPFDILIGAYLQPVETLEYMTAFSKARFRVGCYTQQQTPCYDLFIQLKETDQLPDFLKKALHYLQIINQHERKKSA